ncbi:MAG: hypothetical protein IKK70_06260 [Clostridia bacterium]|nr:hypothetical protein [Clostridia bacterium]
MKKLISALLAVLFVFCLVACDDTADTDKDDNGGSSAQSQVDLNVGDPYELEFRSNGDGTCALTAIKYNRKYTSEFTVDIPEKSPSGDIVTSIEIKDGHVVPRVLSESDFYNIRETLENNSVSGRDPNIFAAFYHLMDINDETLTEKKKEEYRNAYPICAIEPIYILEPTISTQELNRLDAILCGIGGYDSGLLIECADNLYDSAKKSYGDDADDWYEEQVADTAVVSNFVTQINVPSSVTSITVESIFNFGICRKIEKIDGVSDNCKAPFHRREADDGKIYYHTSGDDCGSDCEEIAVDLSEVLSLVSYASEDAFAKEAIRKMGFDVIE